MTTTLWGRLSMATIAAASAFQRAWSDPAGMTARNQFMTQVATYDYRWHLYQNSTFDDAAIWTSYRQRYGLYRYIRPIYNPVRRLVDFYAGIVYPGVLSTDAKRLPDGTPLAIPLAADINPKLRTAIGQLWQWSNWQTGKSLMVRYGAALGDVLVEVVDEVDRGKVTFDIIWPGLVTDLQLDMTGNVKAYAIEYDVEEEGMIGDNTRRNGGKTYTYRKQVDIDTIAEFKNGDLFQYDPGIPAERPNPYGFAPAVWVKHSDLGGDHGSPAVRNVNKIDELNEIASHAHDRAHAVLSSPILAAGEGVQTLDGSKVTPQDEAKRSNVVLLKANSGAMSTVQLPEGEALHYMEQLIAEVETDHPELQMYKELRAMSQVTGPAAERMIGDAAAYIQDARANYDTQSVKLFQMAIAIAGWRISTGAWGSKLTRQQQAFAPFDLRSYQDGDLDMEIMPRPLVPAIKLTPDERRVLMEQNERGFATKANTVEALGGDPGKDMAALEAEQAANDARFAETQPAERAFPADLNAAITQTGMAGAQPANGQAGSPLGAVGA